jgi:DNA-binding transcriptional regulator YdaS (Cro superfamily)
MPNERKRRIRLPRRGPLLEHLRGLSYAELDHFARRTNTSVGHLRNVAGGHKSCGEDLAILIERETEGRVTCEDLRPDVLWSYLRGTAKARRRDE